jgi:peptide/nickel transport system substrate-binding protein
MYRFLLANLMCLLLVLVLLSPAKAETVIRSRLNADILSTDPGTKRDENTDSVMLHIVEGLIAFREDTSVGPLLAKSYEVTADGLTYTFHLRSGVKFHNGAPMTAAEVVWSFNRYLNPATHWRCLPDFDGHGIAKILSVTATDPHTVVLKLDRPNALFLKMLARADCGETAILHPESVNADGSWRTPIGTGPFMLTEWRSNNYIELSKFSGYASLPGKRDGNTGGKHALVDKLRFVIIPDSAAARAALQSGAIDVLDGVTPSGLAALKTSKDILLDFHPTMEIYALLFQTKDPLLKDIRLRRAIAAAIDTVGVTQGASQNTALPNNSIVPTSSPFYDRVESARGKPDLALARKLLSDAGYHGQPIVLISNKRYPQMDDSAILIQAMAAQAGINMTVQTLDWATQLDRYTKGDYQAMAFSYSARLDPALSYDSVIGSKAIEPRKVWDDAIAEDLLAKSTQVTDKAARQALFDSLHKRMLDQVPFVVLYNPVHIAAVRKNVTGFKGWAPVQQRLWDVALGP